MLELQDFVDDVASKDTPSSDFIDPRPNNSRFLSGDKYMDELVSEAERPIMFRCGFPPNTQSRHAVRYVTSSISEKSVALKLYETFDIEATGGVITDLLSGWIEGPDLSNAGPGRQLPSLVLVSASTSLRCIDILAMTKDGIMVVISEQKSALCPECVHEGNADANVLQHLRVRWIRVATIDDSSEVDGFVHVFVVIKWVRGAVYICECIH